jgi:hypothetical protein
MAPVVLMLGLTAMTVAVRAADPPAKPESDPVKAPPGSVIVVVKSVDEGGKFVTNGVLVKLEEWNRLQERIKQLEAQLKPDKPIAPSVCKISGDALGSLVHLKVVFDFVTSRPNQAVALGCAQGNPTEATLDGKLPLLQYGDDGFFVVVDRPGEHQFKLDLDVALSAKSGDRGFDLDLPRAPITTLDLELPEKVREVRFTAPDAVKDPRGPIRATETVDGKPSRFKPDALGAVGRIELSWKGSTTVPGATPLVRADSRATVRAGDGKLLIDLDMTLYVERGQTSQWQILLPGGATLVKPALPDDRIAAYEPPNDKNPAHVFKLKGSSTDPLPVSFRLEQTRPPGKNTFAVGPFLVVGAYQQKGTILVTAPPDLRTSFQLRGEPLVTVIQRELSEDDRREPRAVAGFHYAVHTLDQRAFATLPPFVSIEAETVKEQAAVTTRHTLRQGERGWSITTDLDVSPLRMGGVQQLQLQLPPQYEFDARKGAQLTVAGGGQPSTETVQVTHNTAGRTLTLSLPGPRSDPFRLTFDGLYLNKGTPVAGAGPWQTTLELPQPAKVDDRGGQIIIVVPRDMELLTPGGEDSAWANLVPGRSDYSWRPERMPASVEVSWRSNRPDAPASITADVALDGGRRHLAGGDPGGAGRQGHVRLRLWPAAPLNGPLLLWLPESLPLDEVRFTPQPLETKPPEAADLPKRPGFRPWLITPSGLFDKDHPLLLEYAFTLPEPRADPTGHSVNREFEVPIVRAGKAPRGDLKVRIWCPPASAVSLARGHWEWLPLEPGDGDVLPALVIRNNSDQADQPVLLLTETGLGAGSVQVDRVLIQASVSETGAQSCRARFRLSHLGGRYLDVELPGPAAAISLRVLLRLPGETSREVAWAPLDDSPNGLTVVRLQVGPELIHPGSEPARGQVRSPEQVQSRGAVLELSYQVPPPVGRTLAGALVETTLTPPLLRGGLGRMTVRWQVDLPAAWVAAVQSGAVEQTTWGWRGWLIAPRPAVSPGDLEQWFLSGFDAPTDLMEMPRDLTGVVCWQSSLTPLSLVHVPQQGWLLMASLALLAVALVTYLLLLRGGILPGRTASEPVREQARSQGARTGQRGARLLFWLLVIALAATAALGLLFWPSVLGAVIYGAEPGLLVVFLVVLLQWALHQRYRRQVVFMPGFSRRKTGSSLTQPRDSGRPGSQPPESGSAPGSEPARGQVRSQEQGRSQGRPGQGAGGAPPRRTEPSTVDVPPAQTS